MPSSGQKVILGSQSHHQRVQEIVENNWRLGSGNSRLELIWSIGNATLPSLTIFILLTEVRMSRGYISCKAAAWPHSPASCIAYPQRYDADHNLNSTKFSIGVFKQYLEQKRL